MPDAHFMANILASSTHDMQNILAIIKESGCLVGDVLLINGNPALKHDDKLYLSLEVIEEQVERAKWLLRSLNSFAHAVSDGAQNCDLMQTGKQTARLAERTVRLHEHPLKVSMGKSLHHIACQPYPVMEALYSIIVHAIECCTPKAAITLYLGALEDGSGIATVEADNAIWDQNRLEGLIAKAGGRAVFTTGSCSVSFPGAAKL